jgi:Protein of unknown function (DUF4199)
MENVKKGYFNLSAKWAVIYIITSIVITYAFQFLDVDQSTSPLRFLVYVPLIAFLFLAQKEYRDQLGGFITFGQGFITGLVYAVIVGILAAIFTYLYFTFLSPQAWEQVLAASRDSMSANKNITSDQAERAMEFTTKYGIMFAAAGAVIGTPIVGAIISLIGAAIFKKERSILDIEQSADSSTDPAV